MLNQTDFEVRAVQHLAHARFFDELSELAYNLKRAVETTTWSGRLLHMDEKEAEKIAKDEITLLMDLVLNAVEDQ